jgi:hypothetical protein
VSYAARRAAVAALFAGAAGSLVASRAQFNVFVPGCTPYVAPSGFLAPVPKYPDGFCMVNTPTAALFWLTVGAFLAFGFVAALVLHLTHQGDHRECEDEAARLRGELSASRDLVSALALAPPEVL